MQSSSIDTIIRALHNPSKRRKFVERQFANADDHYRNEWLNREPFAFWCHLDYSNQRRFSEFALEARLSS